MSYAVPLQVAASAVCNDTFHADYGLCGECPATARNFSCVGADLTDFSASECPIYGVTVTLFVITSIVGIIPLIFRAINHWCPAKSSGASETPGQPLASVPSTSTAGSSSLQTRDSVNIGIALSGGGIRSASFSSGVLQKFLQYQEQCMGKKYDKRPFDVLSTVSGGGYLGTAFVHWLQRNNGDWAQYKQFFSSFRSHAGYLIDCSLCLSWRFYRAFLDAMVLIAALFGFFFLYLGRHGALAVFLARFFVLAETVDLLCDGVATPFFVVLGVSVFWYFIRLCFDSLVFKYDEDGNRCCLQGGALDIGIRTATNMACAVTLTIFVVVIFARLLTEANGHEDPSLATLPFLASFLLSGIGSGLIVSLLSSGALAFGYGYVVAIVHDMQICLTCRNDYDRCKMAWPLHCRAGDYKEALNVVIPLMTVLFIVHPALLELHSTWLHYYYRWRLRLAFYEGSWRAKRTQFPKSSEHLPKLYTGITISQWLFAFPEYGEDNPNDKGYLFAGYSDDRIVFFKNALFGESRAKKASQGVQGNGNNAREYPPHREIGQYTAVEHSVKLAENSDEKDKFAHDAKDLDKMMAISGAAVAHELGEAGVSMNKFIHGCLGVISLSFGRWIRVGRFHPWFNSRPKFWVGIALLWLFVASWFIAYASTPVENENQWSVWTTFVLLVVLLIFGSAFTSACYGKREGFWGGAAALLWSLPFMQSVRILFRLDVKRNAERYANAQKKSEGGLNADVDIPPAIYVSDGGHSENLAMLPLVYERVKLLIVADGEQDGRDGKTQTCAGLTKFLDYLRNEYGRLVEPHIFDSWCEGGGGANRPAANLDSALEEFSKLHTERFFVFGLRFFNPETGTQYDRETVVLYLKPRELLDSEDVAAAFACYEKLNEENPAFSDVASLEAGTHALCCTGCLVCCQCDPAGSFPNHSTGCQFFSPQLSTAYAAAGALAMENALAFAGGGALGTNAANGGQVGAKPWRGPVARAKLQALLPAAPPVQAVP